MLNTPLIKYWLEVHGLKLRYLAARVGVNANYLSSLLGNPRNRPSLEVVVRLADVTGYSMDEILGRKRKHTRRVQPPMSDARLKVVAE